MCVRQLVIQPCWTAHAAETGLHDLKGCGLAHGDVSHPPLGMFSARIASRTVHTLDKVLGAAASHRSKRAHRPHDLRLYMITAASTVCTVSPMHAREVPHPSPSQEPYSELACHAKAGSVWIGVSCTKC